MEGNVFPEPAVAGVLTREYIEARLHTDHPNEERRERNLALQDEIQGSLATPFYFLVDPVSQEVLGQFAGSTFDVEKFADFLRSGVEAREARDQAPQVADASR